MDSVFKEKKLGVHLGIIWLHCGCDGQYKRGSFDAVICDAHLQHIEQWCFFLLHNFLFDCRIALSQHFSMHNCLMQKQTLRSCASRHLMASNFHSASSTNKLHEWYLGHLWEFVKTKQKESTDTIHLHPRPHVWQRSTFAYSLNRDMGGCWSLRGWVRVNPALVTS